MRKILVIIGAVAGLMHPAFADPIQGQISAFGFDHYDEVTGDISFGSAGLGAGYGSFAGVSCQSCAVFNAFNYKTGTFPQELYNADLGAGASTSFTLTSLTAVNLSDHALALNGAGTVTLSGFDPTPGTIVLTSQDGGLVDVSFSATTVATPEPASLALLGVGLVGLGLVRRRNPAALASEVASQ